MGVFHVYDNGVRCAVAPCFSFTVRTTQGGEYSASRMNVEALDPATREWALIELSEGRWLVQGTIETTTDVPRPGRTPHVELRVERLAQRVDTRAAALLSASLSSSEGLSGHLDVLSETLASIARRTETDAGPDRYSIRSLDRLRDEFDDLARLYDTFVEQRRRGQPTGSSRHWLMAGLPDLFTRVLVRAVRRHAGADALAATWLVRS